MTKWALAMPMNCDSLEFLFRIGRASTRLARTRASSLKLRDIEAMPVPGLDGVHALQTIDWHRCSNASKARSNRDGTPPKGRYLKLSFTVHPLLLAGQI